MGYCLRRIACRSFISGIIVAVCAVVSQGCSTDARHSEALPYYDSGDLTPKWENGGAHRIASFAFHDQTGRRFTSDSIGDRIFVADFFFTSCRSICPRMTRNFRVLQDSLRGRQDVQLLSFSVMPEVDSAARLKVYGKENQVDPAIWHLLTGQRGLVYSLGRMSFFADGNGNDTSAFLHTDKMFLVDRQKRIRGVYSATRASDMARVLKDISILVDE